MRRGRRVPGLRGPQRPPGGEEFLPPGAPPGGLLLPHPGGEGLPHRQHPGHGPGDGRRPGTAPPCKPVRRGRRHRPGLGAGVPGPVCCPGPAPPRQYPDDHPLPGGGGGGGGAGPALCGPLPGAEPGGYPLHLPKEPHRHRGLCPRGPMHVLVRTVRHERPHRGAQRQPGPLRPALPPALPPGRRQNGPSPEPQGHEPGLPPGGAGEDGGVRPEAGGPYEAARVCGGHYTHLCRPLEREAASYSGGAGAAGAGLLPVRLHRRLLAGGHRPPHVRHPVRERSRSCRPLQGGPGGLREGGPADGAGIAVR